MPLLSDSRAAAWTLAPGPVEFTIGICIGIADVDNKWHAYLARRAVDSFMAGWFASNCPWHASSPSKRNPRRYPVNYHLRYVSQGTTRFDSWVPKRCPPPCLCANGVDTGVVNAKRTKKEKRLRSGRESLGRETWKFQPKWRLSIRTCLHVPDGTSHYHVEATCKVSIFDIRRAYLVISKRSFEPAEIQLPMAANKTKKPLLCREFC